MFCAAWATIEGHNDLVLIYSQARKIPVTNIGIKVPICKWAIAKTPALISVALTGPRTGIRAASKKPLKNTSSVKGPHKPITREFKTLVVPSPNRSGEIS